MKKVLVTGKNGGISLAVAHLLADNGFDVENIGVRGTEWKDISFSDVDFIVHVAGVVPKEGITADDFYIVNYKLTSALAEKAKAEGVKKFVYISSMAVYGVTPTLKKGGGVVYAQTPCAPSSDYGKSKLLAEQSLEKLEDERFKTAIIRVPSVYGKGKTEYLEQYNYSFGRLKSIPRAFTDRYKSIISVDNLCQLIYLIVKNDAEGVFCPDDGRISAFDLATAIMPKKKPSGFLGAIVKLFAFSARVQDYYGQVCYDRKLTEAFDGKYRKRECGSLIKEIYEE